MSELQLPCLDRPFCLGSLYDCQSDTLLPETLWDNTAMEKALQKNEEHSQPTCILDTIVANSQADKMSQLNFSRDLKLNLLIGLSDDVSGPVMSFLEDLSPPSKEACVYLRCQTLSKVEEIATDRMKLDDQQKKIPKQATHVVFKIQYGNDAFFVFDCPEQKVQEVQCTMKDAIEAFNQNISGVSKSPESSPLPVKFQEYKCKSFYTDRHINPQKPVSNLSDVIETCRDRAVNLTDHSAVPQKVWLCPLNRLTVDSGSTNTETATVEVSEKVVTNIQEVFEDIEELQNKVGDLITEQHDSFSKFSTFDNHLVRFQELLIQFTTNMKKKLCSRLPEVRSGKIKEALLIENLEGTSFDPECLRKWLNQAKAEIVELTRQILSHLQDPIEFVNEIPHPQGDVQNVVCFVCNVTVKDDKLLTAMNNYLQTSPTQVNHDNSIWLHESWTENEQVVKALGERFQKFTAYSESNKHLKDVKFVLVDSNCELSADHAIIVLSRPDSKQLFDLPSKPGTPEVTLASASPDYISLQWTEPKEGCQNIESYNVFYCPQSSMPDSQPQNWQTLSTASSNIKIPRNHLESKRKYLFKVSPVLCHIGKVICIESDSALANIRPSQIVGQAAGDDQMKNCQTGKPKASFVTHSAVDLHWTKPEYGSDHVQYYIVSYRLQDSADNKWNQKPHRGSEKMSISGLEPEKKYLFKVKPKCRSSDVIVQDSEVSEPIETKLTCRPGKPEVVLATHNSIHLQWSKPEYGGENVDFYAVNYRNFDEQEWSDETHFTDGPKEEITLKFSDLHLGIQYVFAVRPVCNLDSIYTASDSEISDPIKTVAICQTGKPQPSVVTHNSITVTWDKPNYGEKNVNFYLLCYRSVNDTQWERKNAGTNTSLKVTGLKVHTKYVFQVKPFCDGTIKSLESEISNEIETKPACQPGKPVATLVTHDTVKLKWDKPQYYHDSVGLYTITYQSEHDPPDKWSQKSTTVTEEVQEAIEINGLSIDTEYTFKVIHECKDDSCTTVAESDPVLIKTMPTSKPGQPFVCNIRHNKVEIAWKPPVHGKKCIVSYKVMTQIDDSSAEWTPTETNSLRETATVTGLISNKKYRFKVIPVCQNGHGMEGAVTSPVETPTACQTSKPIASNITHNSVTLTWEKPSSHNDQIKHYHVLCHSIPAQHQTELSQTTITSGIQQMTFTTGGAEERTRVTGLNIDTEYFFKVIPKCTPPGVIGVDSEESERIRTKPASPPENVRAFVVDHNHIKVRWSPPRTKINERISKYRVSISFQSCDSSTDSEWTSRDVSGNEQECIISSLTASTHYIFKVCAIYTNELRIGVESAVTKQSTLRPPEGGLSADCKSVQTKPSCKPGKIRFRNVCHDSIHLEWDHPKDFFVYVKYFIVTCSVQDRQQKTGNPVSIISNHCNLEMKNLKLNTGYVFTVEPVCSQVGFLGLSGSIAVESTQSNVIFTKATSKPSRPAIRDQSSSVTHNSIELSWTLPKFGAQNVKTFFMLCCLAKKMKDPGEWSEHEADHDGSKGRITFDGLLPNTSYVFKVRPKCVAGEGSESNVSSPIVTKATSPPTNLVFTEITHKSLDLSWSRPECGSEIVTHYTVECWKESEPSNHAKTLTTTEECASMTKLEAKTKYLFKVIPQCASLGKSSPSKISDPIKTKPSCQPGTPVASIVTRSYIELKWSKPDFAGDSIQYYTIFYWPVDDPADIHDLKTDGRKESISIGNLFHNTQYKFSICPHCTDSEIGVENSTSDIVTTKATSKPGKPKASVVTHNNVELNWQKPEYGSELVKSYTVSYCNLKDSKVWKSQETNDQQENIVIRGLKLNETYVFKVKSECPCGDGSVSDISDPIVTRATSPPGKPTAIISHDSVILTWSPPEYGVQNVTTYIVSYRSTDESDAERKIRKSVQTNLGITGLKIHTRYSFNVTTECKSGLGMKSDLSDFTTKSTSKPGTPQVISTTNDTAQLKWTKPEQGSENIKSYIILFHQADTLHSETWRQYDTNTTNTIASVTGLQVKTQYVFKVCPACFSGTGSDSDKTEPCWTKATSPPGIPKASIVTHNTIQLKWSKPLHGSENVNHYVVSCHVQRGPSEDWSTEKELKTNGAKDFIPVSNLQPGKNYTFTVRSECAKSIEGMESDISTPVYTCQTSKPIASNITHNSVTLTWEKPAYRYRGDQVIKHYHVLCHSIPAQHQAKLTQSQTTITRSGIQHTAFMHFIMKGPEEHATVANLSIDTEYFFKIVPECTAPEVIGVDSEESERIRTKPASPPESVRASVVDHNHIKVRWSPPKFKIRNISNYRVSYQVQSHAPSTEWKTKDVSGNDNECTIGGLTGSTEYIFKVCVIYANRLQTGVESDVTKSIRTKASCKPGKIVYKDVSHDTIHLEWGQPKNFSSNVKYFVVSHSAQDHQQNVGTPVTYVTECLYHNITVKNLMLNTGYVFTVEPVCSSGFLGLSGSIPIETTQSTVIFTKATSKPGRPSIKDLSSVTHNSIELTWTPPKIGGQNVSTFCVLCRLNVEPMGKWTQHEFQTDGSQGYYNIKVDGLSPHTSYVFKVRPKCAAGQDGSESDLSSPILTKPTSPPHNLVFTEVTPKSLKLSWNRPECGSEKITKYAVAYWKAGNPNAHTKSLTTTEESASIIELEAKTKYIFKVIPECTYYGKSSASENSDPIETKPSCKPGIPVASTVTHNHVELKWPKPDFAGDSIQYYTVFYWPLNDSADIHDLKTDIRKESISIGNLFHNTQYKFSICPHCTDSEIGVENSTSDIVTTKATSKPGKPKASVVTHNSVELNWQKPEYGSELVKSYTVSYCNLKDSKVWKSQETNDQQENIVIRGLKLNETYVFKVKSECPCGDGSVSDISDPIVTRATSPPGKPTAIISHDSVILTWSPPEYGTQNVTTYIVSYRSTDESDAERKIRKSVQTNLKITSLKINTRYSFNVTTECKSGLGMESDSNDFMTKATSKPGTPQVILTTNDTAHLEWTKPEQGSENIKSYMILFTSLGVHSKTQQYNINTTNNTASVTGLEAKMQYVFKVCPVCFSGNGSDSDQSISHWTKATSPPGIPEATNVTHNTIQLKWSKPVQGSENVNHYVLSCRVQRGPSEDWNTEKEFKTNCAQEFVSVSNLQPGSSYTFTVRSQCAVLVKGMESASCQPIKTKLTSPPGKPIVINKQITCTTVSLEWTKPHVGNEYVKYYSVHYKLLDISQNQSGWLCSTQTSNNNTVVTVSQLAPESKYTFKVEPVCESGIGSESECSDVIVTKPSSEPGKPLVTFVTHNSVSLKWEKPKYGSEGIEYYTVLFHTANYPTSDKQTLKGTKECSIKVPNLSPCTKYVFMVRPEFKSGVIADCSDPSDPVETKATSQPGKLVADKVTHDSIQLKWAKPRIGASDIERYIIFYRISDAISEEWTHKHTDDVQGTILLDNLLLNMKYDIYVQPQCQTSTVGAESELVSIETKATSSPGKPTALSVYHNKIHLKWTKPDHGTQNISSYTLLYQSLGTDKQGLSQWIDSQLQSDESAIIESLNPGTRYVFKLLPRCKNGKGTESDTSDPIETKVTSKPGTPEAYIVDHNSLSLRWTKPEHGDDTIVGYVVHYKEDGPKSDRKLQECDVNDIVVGGLAPGKKYVFKIQPKCSKGLGATSDTSDPVETISTSPPGKPRVSAENGSITHDSITIHWTAPTNGTENVTGYTIHYHILKDDSPDCWKKCIVKTPTILSQTVNKLQEKTKYIFKVSSTCRIGIGAESICSEPIETTPLDSGLDINDHYSVYRFLKHMEDTHLRELGGALGLNYTKLTGMKDLRAETVAAWLRAEDDILARSGPPSWSSLVKALRNIGQTGIASKIERELNGMPLCSTSLGAEAETNEQRLLTSKPGKPEAYAIHHNSLSLCWTEPEHGGKSVIGYIVYYKEESSDADWKQQESEINDIVVGGLLSGKKYLFKIQPKCTEGVGAVSDTSDPVETKSTSPPGKPKISEGDGSITHDSISICWKAPRAAKNLIGYTIFYRRRDDSGEDWKIVSCDSSILSHTVKKLKSNTKYIFKVSSTCSTGIGTESEYSEPIETKRCCKPGKPKACNVSHDSIRLEWDNPQYGSVKHYNVQFKEVGIAYWSVESTNKNSIKLENLRPQSCYDIQVFPCCQESEIGIKCSELATIQTEKISLAERMKAKSHLLSRGKSGCLDTYQVPMWIVVEDELKMIRKCFVGEDTFQNRFHSGKVIMLVGATGTGKSTLINGLVNHVLGVKWEHSYRFKMIVENTQADQTKSQTKWITSYTIDLQAMEGSPIKYPLTIIDTPGFGDTEGIERDQIVIEQIRDFFCTPGDGGIDQIHAIGFATHAGLVRLTHLQKYIFDSIMSVFGNDVKDNILMMTTFADGQPPPVLQAVKEAGVPYHKAFKFNNSALFANNGATSAIDKMFWEMGKTGFIEFFDELTQTKPRSLTLTKEVLEEREHLEVCVEGLQQRMHAGLSKITTLHQEEQILKKYEAQLHLNEDFTYTIDVTKQRRVDIPVGKCVTNCLTCYHTCHYPCPIPKDEDKHSCAAMGDKRYTPEARCTICPGKCHWKQHANNPYRFETYQDHITKTSEDLKKRYHDAEAGKMQVENMIAELHQGLDAWYTEVLQTIRQTHQSLKRLQEIALKPNPLTEVGYIELLIESEKQEAKPGYLQRIQSLKKLRESIKVLKKLTSAQEQLNPIIAGSGTKPRESLISDF